MVPPSGPLTTIKNDAFLKTKEFKAPIKGVAPYKEGIRGALMNWIGHTTKTKILKHRHGFTRSSFRSSRTQTWSWKANSTRICIVQNLHEVGRLFLLITISLRPGLWRARGIPMSRGSRFHYCTWTAIRFRWMISTEPKSGLHDAACTVVERRAEIRRMTRVKSCIVADGKVAGAIEERLSSIINCALVIAVKNKSKSNFDRT